MPPVTVLPFEGPRAENGLYRVATPAEARINKRRAINFNPKIFEHQFDDERPAVYSKCLVKEAKLMAEMEKVYKDVSRWWDKGIRFHDNHRRKRKIGRAFQGSGLRPDLMRMRKIYLGDVATGHDVNSDNEI